MKNYISIDIGGTAIKYGVIDENGNIIIKNQMKTEAYKGGKAILSKISSIINELKSEYTTFGVCISTAGIVDTEKGSIIHAAPTIPEYTGTEIKKFVEENFNIVCEVENDVNCAGLAEYISGSGKGSKIALCLTIGTGIGGAIIINDKIFHGASNSACEVGYMHMFDSNFENLGASSILSKNVAEKKNSDAEIWNGIKIFTEAKKGDLICIEAIDNMVDILGRGIANICYVLNPDIVILGGGIMAQKEYLKDRLENALDKYLVSPIRKNTKLSFAKHENNAGMLGAFYNFKQKHNI